MHCIYLVKLIQKKTKLDWYISLLQDIIHTVLQVLILSYRFRDSRGVIHLVYSFLQDYLTAAVSDKMCCLTTFQIFCYRDLLLMFTAQHIIHSILYTARCTVYTYHVLYISANSTMYNVHNVHVYCTCKSLGVCKYR